MSKKGKLITMPIDCSPPKIYSEEELEDLAFVSAPLPEGLNLAQTLLFLSFRSLYDFARRVEMPQEQGRREKQKLLQAYAQYQHRDHLQDRTVKLWRELEEISSAYRKHDRNDLAGLVVVADNMMQTIYGLEESH